MAYSEVSSPRLIGKSLVELWSAFLNSLVHISAFLKGAVDRDAPLKAQRVADFRSERRAHAIEPGTFSIFLHPTGRGVEDGAMTDATAALPGGFQKHSQSGRIFLSSLDPILTRDGAPYERHSDHPPPIP